MMKRIAALVLVGLLALSVDLFALKSTPDLGIGVELTSVNFGTMGAMMTLHFPSIPLFFGIGGNFVGGLSGGPELAATIDYWLLHNPLGQGYISWYLGVGGYAALALDPNWLALGIRVPIALQIWPLANERLELSWNWLRPRSRSMAAPSTLPGSRPSSPWVSGSGSSARSKKLQAHGAPAPMCREPARRSGRSVPPSTSRHCPLDGPAG